MRVLHLKHLDALIEHEVMWSFSFASKYFPPWFLTMYIREMKLNTLLLGTPREAKPLGDGGAVIRKPGSAWPN